MSTKKKDGGVSFFSINNEKDWLDLLDKKVSIVWLNLITASLNIIQFIEIIQSFILS